MSSRMDRNIAARLVSLLLIAGTAALIFLVVTTYEPPGVAPLVEMAEDTAAHPRLDEQCEIGGEDSVTICYWTLRLDDGRRLEWPWANPGGVGRVGAYLRDHAPITVHSWRGMVFQIDVNDGHPYLEYADTASRERHRQGFLVAVGVIVAGAAVARVALELKRLGSASVTWRCEWAALGLDGACLFGASTLGLAGVVWWGVIALAVFAGAADVLGRSVVPHELRACRPRKPSSWHIAT